MDRTEYIFRGGPADNIATTLGRAPLLLRVCYDPLGDDFRFLDQLDDAVGLREACYVYARGEDRASCGPDWSRRIYQFMDPQPDRSVFRDNARWRDWVRSQIANRKSQMEAAG